MEDRPKVHDPRDMRAATPAGESGVEDHRESLTREGHGRVRDAAGIVSSETHSFSTDANGGNETENSMNENNTDIENTQQQGVDGFADTQGETNVSSPDPGVKRETEPLDPEEYAEQQKEARSEEQEK